MALPKCLRDLKYDTAAQEPCSAGQCQWPQCDEHRLSCCVPFCRRTKQNRGDEKEWICAEHWRAVPRKDRAIYARVKREAKAAGRWTEAAARIWRRVKRIAIERGVGI